MTAALLAFVAGAILLQQQAALPGVAWYALLPVLGAILLWKPRTLPLVTFAIGFFWAAACAHLHMADRLAPELEGRDLEIVGVVASLPAQGERSVRFEFEIESAPEKLPGRVLLSWYRSARFEDEASEIASAIHPGDRWLLTVRLRRPHGLVNPHGFDYEAWLMERGIGGTGYVRQKGLQRKIGERNSPSDFIERAREAVRDRFLRVLGETPAAGILGALAVGDQRAISNEEWRLFARTGVTHLMSISGLHVTLVSGLAAALVAFGWRRSAALALRLPARKAAALAAIAAALGYSLLAGFAVPAQRTCYMVSVAALALWAGRIASPARTLALALGAVTALDPWAVLAPGFWLSFGAVALIFFVHKPEMSWIAQWARVQWAITIGLAPAALFLFGQVSLVGPLANAIAIPLVSAVITPLALLAAVLPMDLILNFAELLTLYLLQFLEWCASSPLAVWQQHAPPLWATLAALAGALWLLAPRGVPWRACGAALALPAFALPAPAPAPGEAWITTLDVGQGLAVLVRTANHALLYDAGPAFGAESDSGERVVAPYLRAAGLERLDALVITHNDADHAGGAASVLENFPVAELRSSLDAAHPLLALAASPRRCAAGQGWAWDGVRLAFLHPAAADYETFGRANNLSCVLKVTAGERSMLLTGDIERAAESALLAREAPGAEFLLAPHHGSRTSSGPEFLASVRPRLVVVAAGYRNRFRHPSEAVLARYAAAGAGVLRTDLDGAVAVKLWPGGAAAAGERAAHPRYWRGGI